MTDVIVYIRWEDTIFSSSTQPPTRPIWKEHKSMRNKNFSRAECINQTRSMLKQYSPNGKDFYTEVYKDIITKEEIRDIISQDLSR